MEAPRRRRLFPLAPGFAEIEPRAEAEFADRECAARFPAFRQPVAGKKDVAAFEPSVGAAIKVIAKFLRIGHIALVPFEVLPRG